MSVAMDEDENIIVKAVNTTHESFELSLEDTDGVAVRIQPESSGRSRERARSREDSRRNQRRSEQEIQIDGCDAAEEKSGRGGLQTIAVFGRRK